MPTLENTFTSDAQLATIQTDITGAETATLTETDYSETDNGDGTYTYAGQYEATADGDYTFTLTTAETSGGDPATWGAQSTTYTVGSPYPNSAVHQWPYDEGSGTTVADSIGTNDGTITGATWVSDSSSEGEFKLSFDGTDDHVEYNSRSIFSVSQSWSFAVTVEADTLSQEGHILTISDNENDRVGISIFNGVFDVSLYDGAYTSREMSAEATTNRFRLGVSYDNSTDTIEIYKDGTQADDGAGNDVNPGGGGVTDTLLTGAKSGFSDGELTSYLSGDLDNPVAYDAVLSSSEFTDDYNAQPWV